MNKVIIAGVITVLTVGVFWTWGNYQKSDKLDPAFKQAFIEGCAEEASYSMCACMYAELDSKLTNEEFVAVAIRSLDDPDGAARELLPLVTECL